MIIYDYNFSNIEGVESIHVQGYNTGNIEDTDNVIIDQYNTGSIEATEVHVKEYNTGTIKAMNSVIVDGYNTGSIEALSIHVKGHNSGSLESDYDITLEGHNMGKVSAKVIAYKGLKLSLGKLSELSQGSKITHNGLTLARKDEKKWEIEEDGSVNELKTKDGLIEMVYKRGSGSKGAININGITISGSGSITIIPDGSIHIN